MSTDATHVRLGRCALLTSRLWLGTAALAGQDDADAVRLLDHARSRGVNCLDTADDDSASTSAQVAEESVGRWLAGDTGRREETVLSVTVGVPPGGQVGGGGLSARQIIASCEGSLRRLGVDHVDVLHLPRVDRVEPWDEVWQAVDALVAAGKVCYVGSSGFPGWHIVAAQEHAVRRHRLGLVSHQCRYDLTSRHPELEVLPAAQAYGLGVFARPTRLGGLLGGDGPGAAAARASGQPTALRSAVEAYEVFCRDLGEHPAEVALAWVLSRPGVAGAVVGARTPGRLDSALRACGVALGATELTALDGIFPGVAAAGAAPEAWLR
ncbi:aldo/keto reductase [Micromonospora sp. NPDC000207]|uniref:TDP-4-keto-6-deoxyglucose 2,3 dehydratase n=1 Tax=Micromonospora megalomicea subsp. nigra TaxID=136926 RepID=Q9F825_MICMH|nr:TDP-4-keto-6-deoxyglucose 2,3 dehydratase [Micromonospora megalomicea subsp. nigra]